MLLQRTSRRASGELTMLGEDAAVSSETMSCVHHQGVQWLIQPGSGRERGWCFKCNGPTCRPRETCLPWERQFEQMERRSRLLEAVARNFGS